MWWGSINSRARGYFERCFNCGYSWNLGQMYKDGLLRGKTGLVVICASGPEDAF